MNSRWCTRALSLCVALALVACEQQTAVTSPSPDIGAARGNAIQPPCGGRIPPSNLGTTNSTLLYIVNGTCVDIAIFQHFPSTGALFAVQTVNGGNQRFYTPAFANLPVCVALNSDRTDETCYTASHPTAATPFVSIPVYVYTAPVSSVLKSYYRIPVQQKFQVRPRYGILNGSTANGVRG